MRITPNISDSPAANSAYWPPTSTPWTSACTTVMPHRRAAGVAHVGVAKVGARAEVRGDHVVAAHLTGPAGQHHPAFEHAVHPVAYLHRTLQVLLDQQDSGALGADRAQGVVELVDDHRRQSQRHLVEQQHPRVGHQRAGDRHGLPLPARQRVGAPVPQPGDQREDLVGAFERPRPRPPCPRPDLQVLLDGQAREEPPALRGERHPEPDAAVRRHRGDVAALPPHDPPARAQRPGERGEQRRLPGAVGADQRHRLALVDGDRDAVQRLHVSVMRRRGGRASSRDRRSQQHRPRTARGRPARPAGRSSPPPAGRRR